MPHHVQGCDASTAAGFAFGGSLSARANHGRYFTVADTVQVSEYKGLTVAVDGYTWLHKAVYGCSTQLALGQESDSYVKW